MELKIAFFIIVISVSNVFATPTYSQVAKVSLNMENKNLEQVMDEIESQSEFYFIFNQKQIDVNRVVSIQEENRLITDILPELFKGTNVNYAILDRKILLTTDPLENNLLAIASGTESQQNRITGTVTDKDRTPLPGVNVVVTGTTLGTMTDIAGKYSIEVPPGSKSLTFSFIGMVSQEIIIGTLTQIDVTMTESAFGLEEVVVIGYGTQKKVSLTGAVGQVKGDNLTVRTVNNIQQTLQGQVAGLTIIDNGASPGRTNMTMRIRGITTLGANDPLVIVDGIEQPLDNINPQDIESVSVLKDASSTAIYGSRAANGVLLITTKRAKSGKLSVTYSSYYALQKSNNNPVHMSTEDYMKLQNVAWTNSSGAPIYTEDYIKEYLAGTVTDPLKYPLPNTWHKAVLHTAPQFEHFFSMSGGGETIKTLLSLRYQDQEGITANSDSKISELRLNTDYKVSQKINITTDINYRNTNRLTPLNEGNIFNRMLQTSQWTVPKYPDGTYGISSDGHNPLFYAEGEGTIRTNNNYLTGNIKGNLEILKGLTFSAQFSARIIFSNGKSYRNNYEIRDYFNPSIVRKSLSINNMTLNRTYEQEFTINNLLNYSTTLGSHSLNILAGYSQINNSGDNLSAFRQGFYNNDIQSISQGANDATKSNSGSEYEWGLSSYFGRFNYSYQDKYLFEANARYDGSSRFVAGNRYSFFPSFSAGWRISQEDFWSRLKNTVNEFKFRASWGQTGNQAVPLYSYIATLNLQTYSFNGVSAPGFRQSTMANKDLTWETTTQTDIGLDAQFLDNRISLTVDYYYKRTDDILLSLPVPMTLGLLASPQNAGRMDNKGWEFLVGTQNRFGQFGFDGNINFTINDNVVVDLVGTGPYISGSSTSESRFNIAEGYPYNSVWGMKVLGLFQTVEEVANYPNFKPGTKPGDVKYEDINKDGKITDDDMTYLGRSFPKYTFSSNLDLSYKNFTLRCFLQGVAGVNARIGGAITQMGIWGGFAHKLIANNYWTPENPNARFSRPIKYDTRNDPAINSSRTDQMSGTYLRLKNLQLMYQIPSSLTTKAHIEKMIVYVSTTNLLTFSELNEWNLDPESAVGGRTEQYPQTSLTTIGLNIQF